ncbi:ABC transporter ATP-binding protein [Alicyclobacillus sp.]|uniref:ABC transporter ATP-binding protein n=1 Tax=Alicyclobacillus sp. TaxID=61169 RepID=UPI0025BC6916|nr:ABC transporter ATP-binding protein [Alicyclobacillus sp.]
MDNPRQLLKRYFLRHRWSYALSILSIVASEIVMVQFPHLLGAFTDALQAGRVNGPALLRYTLWLAAVGIGYVALYGFGQMRNGTLGRKFEYELRRTLFLHWETLSTSYFRQRSVGDLLNHALNDVRSVRDALSGGLNILTNAVFLLASTLVMTFRTVSVRLTLVSMIPIVVVPFLVGWLGPRIRQATRQAQEALSDMADLTEESITAIRLIKATANEAVEQRRFTDRVDAIVRRQMGVFRRSALMQSLIPFMGSLAFVVALTYGGYLTITRQIPLGAFVAFTLYLAMLITPLQEMGFVFNYFQRASASLQRLEVLLTEMPDIHDERDAVALPPVRGEVRIRLNAFTYPDGTRPALHDVDIRVEAGKTLGIVGRTGSGKTTLVNLLPRIFDPPPGTVFIDGHDVRSVTLRSLRQAISYVPQDGFLFSTTIGENIGFSKEGATEAEILEAARLAAFDEVIETFPEGLDTVVGERGVTLSGGQRQRAAIARALLKDAPILILDDSLSAVDMNTEKTIIANLQRARRGRTTIVIAHRLSAVRHADHIVVLDRGTVVEAGTHEELIRRGGLYAEIYRLQETEQGVTA